VKTRTRLISVHQVNRISLTLHFTTSERPKTTTTYSERHQVFDELMAPLPFRVSKVHHAGKGRGARAFAYCLADVSRSPFLDVVDLQFLTNDS
jgi:hypothetical protein